MKERPILFNAEMVRAILDGRKTQTRRVIKPQPPQGAHFALAPDIVRFWVNAPFSQEGNQPVYDKEIKVPYLPGCILWVREALTNWAGAAAYKADIDAMGSITLDDVQMVRGGSRPNLLGFAAWVWKRDILPSIFMPRWASRITLEIVDVRVERVWDITHHDAIAEGIYGVMEQRTYYVAPGLKGKHPSPEVAFSTLWNSINVKRGFGWDTNPWVWVVEFSIHNGN